MLLQTLAVATLVGAILTLPAPAPALGLALAHTPAQTKPTMTTLAKPAAAPVNPDTATVTQLDALPGTGPHG